MITYNIDILKELSAKGYTPTRLRREKLICESTMQRMRRGEPFGMDALNTVCCILRCQPSDIIKIEPSDEEKIKFF